MTLKKDEGKTSFIYIPFNALEMVAKVTMFGAKKHSPMGWSRGTYTEARQDFFDAAFRHLVVKWWQEKETYDKETGLPHLAHAACNILFLLWYELRMINNTKD